MVSLQTVSRHFAGGRVRAVDGVDLGVAAGEWLTITGASGSGKSTLLNLISGLDLPTAGQVLLEGRPLVSRRDWARVRAGFLGLIFQAFHLVPTLTAAENVELPLFGRGLGRRARQKRARGLLERVGLGPAAGRLPAELSGGELQRVGIARALANQPRLLLADEPTGNLDSTNSQQIMDLLRELHLETACTVIVVTHDPLWAAWGTQRVAMRDGRIIAWRRCPLHDPSLLDEPSSGDDPRSLGEPCSS
ncbi:MAG: ABC transporter ATP-binding protein [Deltaproteobacteria bacterium]|nr:ABC transporter ATP-binding protein [Deltaproteobacteria bacterium]